VAERLLGTGVELRALSGDRVTGQTFAELEGEDGQTYRMGGSATDSDLDLSGGPTTALLAFAHDVRANQLGDLLGDLRRQGIPVERWDFYSSPFRIDLDDALRRHVAPAGLGVRPEEQPRELPVDQRKELWRIFLESVASEVEDPDWDPTSAQVSDLHRRMGRAFEEWLVAVDRLP
jgi:hypothetical protein